MRLTLTLDMSACQWVSYSAVSAWDGALLMDNAVLWDVLMCY